MLLFFYVLLCFIVIIFLLIITLIKSVIRITIRKFEISCCYNDLKIEFEGKIGVYFLGKIKLFESSISNNKMPALLKNKRIQERLSRTKEEYEAKQKWKIIKDFIVRLKKAIVLDSFKFTMFIDTENVLLTSYLTGIISTLIPNLIRKNLKNLNDYKLEINPIYKNKNYINIKLNSIISIKLVHIIDMLKLLGGKKNERSSNRRLNANCYGKY